MATVALSGIITPSNVVTATSTTTLTNKTLTGAVMNGTLGATTPSTGAFTSVNTPDTFGFKNRIINGDMRIDQRNAGASVVVGSGAFPVDRWFAVEDTDGALTAEQVEDVPAGFVNSIKITTTTADTNLTTTQTAQFMQNIEGFNVSDLGFGSASAQTVTLSFWVKSSLTGTMGGSVRNDSANRSYPFSYTISSANTWEQKSITIAGDTSGTWLTNNGIGIRLVFSLGCGPSRLGTAGAWNANNNTAPTGEVPVIGTLNATWYVTGVQLEKGSTATSFDVRPYGTEFQLCQRYCYKISTSGGYSTFATTGQFVSATRVDFPILFPTYMRASPTATYTAANTYLPSSAGTDFTPSAVASVGGSASPQAIAVNFTVSGGTAGRAATLTDLNTTSSSMIFSAEL